MTKIVKRYIFLSLFLYSFVPGNLKPKKGPKIIPRYFYHFHSLDDCLGFLPRGGMPRKVDQKTIKEKKKKN